MTVRNFAVLLLTLLMPLSVAAQDLAMTRYTIDSKKSWIRVLVYRAGLMSGFGHNHVVSSNDVAGLIECSDRLVDTVATLSFSANSLVVDDKESRELEGEAFSSDVSVRDIEGTRKNMLGRKLLNASQFSDVQILTTAVSGEHDALKITANIIVAGKENSIEFTAAADLSDDQMTISGTADISHRDLGLKPFSAALGMLKVKQNMTVRFFLVARPSTVGNR